MYKLGHEDNVVKDILEFSWGIDELIKYMTNETASYSDWTVFWFKIKYIAYIRL